MPATWDPGSQLFALEYAFCEARKKFNFTRAQLNNLQIAHDPIFQHIATLTVNKLYARLTITSGGDREFLQFNTDLLQYIQANAEGEFCERKRFKVFSI